MIKMKYAAVAAHTALGLLLCATAPFAAASVSAGISMSNVQFKVTDLTPNDGQAGGIANVEQYSWISSTTEGPRDSQFYRNIRPATSSSTSPVSVTMAASTGVAGEVRSTSEVHGTEFVYSSAVQDSYFSLLPHTSITVSWHTDGFVQTDAALADGHAGADALMYFYRRNTFDYLQYASTLITSSDYPNGTTYSRDFRISYANNTDTAMPIQWRSEVSSDGRAMLPVPEPESYAMLGAGLALIGLVARRRQRRRQG